MSDGDEDGGDRLNLSGPLTVEAILRTLQERFIDGHCYVSTSWCRARATVSYRR